MKFNFFNFLKKKKVVIDLNLIKDLILSDLDENILPIEIKYDECFYKKDKDRLPFIKSGYVEIPSNSIYFDKDEDKNLNIIFKEKIKYIEVSRDPYNVGNFYYLGRGRRLKHKNGIVLYLDSLSPSSDLRVFNIGGEGPGVLTYPIDPISNFYLGSLQDSYKEYYDIITQIFNKLNKERFSEYNIGFCLCKDIFLGTYKYNILFYNK